MGVVARGLRHFRISCPCLKTAIFFSGTWFDNDGGPQTNRPRFVHGAGKSNNRIGGSDLGWSSTLQLFNCILRLGSGEKQLVVSGINDATKGGITPRTFKAITFKPALVDM